MKLCSEIKNIHDICNHHIMNPFLFLNYTDKTHCYQLAQLQNTYQSTDEHFGVDVFCSSE